MKGKSVTRPSAISGAQKKGKCRADAPDASRSAPSPLLQAVAVEKFVENCRKLRTDNTWASACAVRSVSATSSKPIIFQSLSMALEAQRYPLQAPTRGGGNCGKIFDRNPHES